MPAAAEFVSSYRSKLLCSDSSVGHSVVSKEDFAKRLVASGEGRVGSTPFYRYYGSHVVPNLSWADNQHPVADRSRHSHRLCGSARSSHLRTLQASPSHSLAHQCVTKKPTFLLANPASSRTGHKCAGLSIWLSYAPFSTTEER